MSPAAQPQPLRLRISSDPANLAPVRRQLEKFAQACGFDEQARGEIVLVVNEAMANITRHAYDDAHDKPIELDATFVDRKLAVTLRDWGSGKAPKDKVFPERDPLRPGGVGLVCLKKLMDLVRFDPQPDGMLLTMERKL